jgi:F-type H+-transporting ATPase subunit alpha
VPREKVKSFESEFIELLDHKYRDVLDKLRDGIFNDDITRVLEKTATELTAKYRV